MKIGIIVLCRYSSSRLPGKILKPIQGKPILQYIHERLQGVKGIEDIVIATSTEKSDDQIETFCLENNLKYFRGDLNNVSKRFLDCAIHYGFDYGIRINGDNLFVDPQPINEMIDIVKSEAYDLVTNVKGRSFPYGMSIEVVNTKFYQEAVKRFNTSEYKEHVTLYFYEHPEAGNFYYYYNKICPEAKGLKLAVDAPEDFVFSQRIIEQMDNTHTFYGLKEIYNIAKSLK